MESRRRAILFRKFPQIGDMYDFGKLTVMPDGQIYVNLHVPAIGRVTESPHAIVYCEPAEGHS